MTQEDKGLLLKDLCARLPYGVKVKTNRGPELVEGLWPFGYYDIKITGNFDWWYLDFKPYLRPMYSMTEEEKEEIKPLFSKFTDEFEKTVLVIRQNKMALYQDWLNAHHFDYRSLIEKGLALEASEGMYTDDKFVPITKEELEKTRISSKDYLI